MTERLGIIGGTFDPIHEGHLAAADAAAAALRLDRVLFVPAAVPPHRPAPPAASAYHRFAMVALAVSTCTTYEASDLELRLGGPSFTSRTLAHLASEGHTPGHLYFITGLDAFREIATWHGYPELLQRARFVVVSRPGGAGRPLERALPALAPYMRDVDPGGQGHDAAAGGPLPSILRVAAATPDISSTDIRARLDRGEPLGGAVPDLVERHIRRHGLYLTASTAATQTGGGGVE